MHKLAVVWHKIASGTGKTKLTGNFGAEALSLHALAVGDHVARLAKTLGAPIELTATAIIKI